MIALLQECNLSPTVIVTLTLTMSPAVKAPLNHRPPNTITAIDASPDPCAGLLTLCRHALYPPSLSLTLTPVQASCYYHGYVLAEMSVYQAYSHALALSHSLPSHVTHLPYVTLLAHNHCTHDNLSPRPHSEADARAHTLRLTPAPLLDPWHPSTMTSDARALARPAHIS